MKLFLHPNIFNAEQKSQAASCFCELIRQGHELALSDENSLSVFGDTKHAGFPASESDLIVSLGGDGAVLRASQLAIREQKPLIGINSGHVGFLCALSFSEITNFISILNASTLSKRHLLAFTYAGEERIAVNDVIIAKKNYGSTANLSVSVPDLGSFQLRSDGLIVATPTGSTAYNYSAGGPVIDPRCHSFVITPLATHNRNLCPLVVNDDFEITVSTLKDCDTALVLSDGHELGVLQGEIRLSRSDKVLFLYTKDDLIRKIQ